MTRKKHAVAILQARMSSSRLPGKVLMDLLGRPVIAHCVERVAHVDGIDEVCVATGDRSVDDSIVEFVRTRTPASVFRGAEDDVLGRYLGAARQTRADLILRVTCDCPLIDPEVTAKVVAACSAPGVDFATNNMPPSFPHGLDCEAFTRDVLERAAADASDAYDREHVTPWMRRQPYLRRVNVAHENADLSRERWTLDYAEDLAFLRAVMGRLPADSDGRMRDVLSVLDASPALREINANRRVQHA